LCLERRSDQTQSFNRLALLMPEHTEEMQRVEIVRIGRENGLIDSLGLFEMSLLMQRQCLPDGMRRVRALRGSVFAHACVT
jgi:hypothetical protein